LKSDCWRFRWLVRIISEIWRLEDFLSWIARWFWIWRSRSRGKWYGRQHWKFRARWRNGVRTKRWRRVWRKFTRTWRIRLKLLRTDKAKYGRRLEKSISRKRAAIPLQQPHHITNFHAKSIVRCKPTPPAPPFFLFRPSISLITLRTIHLPAPANLVSDPLRTLLRPYRRLQNSRSPLLYLASWKMGYALLGECSCP